jgi:putative membrane protein
MIKKYGFLFLKGMAMGAADVVPGVSGGTIAFITNIYETLIHALSQFNLRAIHLLLKGQFKEFWSHINGTFLAVLFAGIFTSVLSLAALLSHTLETYPIHLWSFFFGLVFASIFIVGKQVSQWKWSTVLSFAIGCYTGVLDNHLTCLFRFRLLCLPRLVRGLGHLCNDSAGISGSFILLLLGAYATVLEAIADREFAIIAAVGIGALGGLLSFTKLLKWVFEKYHDLTVALLSGFLLGSLNKIWPWKEVIGDIHEARRNT